MRNRGFTLIELLVVITIIGILATIVMVSLGESREKARNQAVISQMQEYKKALELYYAQHGFYPAVTPRANEVCFGPTGACWTGATQDGQPIRTALAPYMSDFPYIKQGAAGSPAYNGCSGTFFNNNNSCTSNDYSLFFLLEGYGRDCEITSTKFDVNFGNTGQWTMCRLMPTSY